MNDFNQKVIPSLATVKEFKKFMDSEEEYAILMEFHLSAIGNLVKEAHAKGKKILLHMDMTKGISGDEVGCEFACQVLQVDGILSSRVRVVEATKKFNKIAILRIFLLDSTSLDRGIAVCKALKPDYAEVLPGIASSILPYISKETGIPLLCGGLIKTQEQIDACLEAGACAVTMSEWYQ